MHTCTQVYTWGSGSWGKLGTGTDANSKVPRLVATLQSQLVESVACGAHHCAAITAAGDVWTWGKGIRGQLGHNSVKEEFSPRIIAMLRKRGADRVRCSLPSTPHTYIHTYIHTYVHTHMHNLKLHFIP
jgi:alpha-tubulin suppressor-like RCC1 family protein